MTLALHLNTPSAFDVGSANSLRCRDRLKALYRHWRPPTNSQTAHACGMSHCINATYKDKRSTSRPRKFTPAMADVEEIVNKLLKGADDDSITERKLRIAVEKELGRELSDGEVKSVEAAVEEHCSQAQPQAEAAAAAPDNPAAEAAEPPAAAEAPGQKRKAAEEPGEDETAPKRPATPAAAAGDGTNFALSDTKRVDVRKFKGKVLVDLREHYKDKASGELKPGKKGLALSVEQWEKLSAAIPALSAALEGRDTSYSLALSNNRKATVSEFKGVVRVDVREYYEAAGVLKHSAKGVALDASAWAKLVSNQTNITAAVASV